MSSLLVEQQRGGTIGTMAIAAVAALAGICIAVRSFPWYATVIGAGLVLLAIPLLLRPSRIAS